MMTREELADRLFDATLPNMETQTTDEMWLAVADEALRIFREEQ